MAIRVVRLGTARHPDEGPRLGTVRRPPRGVPKSQFAVRNYYDVWLPELAPSAAALSWGLAEPWTAQRWRRFELRYRREMKGAAASHLIGLLAALSQSGSFSVGCYCADSSRCHRRVLAGLLADAGALLAEPVV